ncbi:MAG TPA: Sec-independent protein translocase protein TatB [Pseudonocardiaceae bacterium]|jgi:sec-independent protein translocase protein TatB|nr:Sec-independent protein translocase protein TatB [Pseudonocardiaceae bacterium]
MFDISGPDFLVLVVAALFILGPERLPGATRWVGRAVRQVRDYAAGARDQIQSELGPDFDELRAPLQDLGALRKLDPRQAVTQHLLDATGGYRPQDDLQSLMFGTPKPGAPAGVPHPQHALALGERPPFDPDTT